MFIRISAEILEVEVLESRTLGICEKIFAMSKTSVVVMGIRITCIDGVAIAVKSAFESVAKLTLILEIDVRRECDLRVGNSIFFGILYTRKKFSEEASE